MNLPVEPPAGDWIRGITIQQPHLACILAGAKTVENRSQPWSWRGWLLLHAAQHTDRPALRIPQVARTVRGREMPTGSVLGLARLTGCHQDPDGAPPCSRWAQPGAWHLTLTDIVELPLPVPARGQLGPWRPTEDLLAQVLQQLPNLTW
ncbi:hypothetical protein [Streptomyces albus]|uniref:hypothetical protein n=1 Tax=Streptomyces albus TaxID=1888 RepID=UPI0034551F7D